AMLLGTLTASIGGGRAGAVGLSAGAILAILAERVDVGKQSTGIVAVVSDDDASRQFTYGRPDTSDNRPLDGSTVFEIGSITKVLTALLLADMVEHGEVAFVDPVAKYLPDSVRVPEFHGKAITLIDLASYTSGLPRMPDNIISKDPLNPFADYTTEQLYSFLSSCVLKFEPGTHIEYSNVAFALLGVAIAACAGKSYEQLLIERICEPLGLHDTRISLTPSMSSRIAQGHDPNLERRPLWDLGALAAAGAVRSTANDLTVFLEACLGRRRTSLGSALGKLLEVRKPYDEHGLAVGLGWFISSGYGDQIVWKDGGSGGFAAYVGFSPAGRRGSIVLSNAANWHYLDDIGMHLIDPDFPLLNLIDPDFPLLK
ncbi:MAG: beta-lactamase family protein, partial [Alphaproteobacteria bacterium]